MKDDKNKKGQRKENARNMKGNVRKWRVMKGKERQWWGTWQETALDTNSCPILPLNFIKWHSLALSPSLSLSLPLSPSLSLSLSLPPSLPPSLVSLPLCLYINISIYLSIYLSVCLSVCLSICLAIYLGTAGSLFVCGQKTLSETIGGFWWDYNKQLQKLLGKLLGTIRKIVI